MDIRMKKENPPTSTILAWKPGGYSIIPREGSIDVINLRSSNEEESEESADRASGFSTKISAGQKRPRNDSSATTDKRLAVVVPKEEEERFLITKKKEEGFGRSVPPPGKVIVALPAKPRDVVAPISSRVSGKQFWKAGDYEGPSCCDWEVSAGGFDHVRVHPKFLHSNATSHKWSLGAFAELLDNALDEVQMGATHVIVDTLNNRKHGNRMVLIEDNGGGMSPEKMRHCMSLGYSEKSKLANTIGQYGNGFKTSTMRLGADVVVFSRCRGNDGKSYTQSIGLLSYTFLTSTGKEDIVVPMLDYERRGSQWCPIIRSSVTDWDKIVETVIQWSPFSSEDDLLSQFNLLQNHGTRIIIYIFWEDDDGMLELDFDTDPHDIQLRGVNREEKNIKMASQYPNCRHFFTYKHSLRSYASILYLRVPPEFRIILRGRVVEHHNLVNDMMQTEIITYKPLDASAGSSNPSKMRAVVTIGFVKDAIHHVDVQGFNVYHKNRLIKPFWRVWNAAGSGGRGTIGVLEANFVEPAHDKQGFERTQVLHKLEARLKALQREYWNTWCHKIGYAPKGAPAAASEKFDSRSNESPGGNGSAKDTKWTYFKSNIREKPQVPRAGYVIISDDDCHYDSSIERHVIERPEKSADLFKTQSGSRTLSQWEQESEELRHRLSKKEEVFMLLKDELRREKELRKKLEAEIQTTKEELEEIKKEQDSLIAVFVEDRDRRDKEEEDLRNKLEEATKTIEKLRGR